jgi:hypothetical protein
MFIDCEVPDKLPEIKYIDISDEEYMKIQSLFSMQPERLNPETQMVGWKFRGPIGYGGAILPVRCDSLNSMVT